MRNQALAFWNEVYQEFPSGRVYHHMTAVAEDRADWFRNLSLTRVAVAENSEGTRGFSMRRYEENMERLEEIVDRHQAVTELMQN